MTKPLSKEQGQAYKSRWKIVAETELQELRESNPEDKLRQLWALMSSVSELGWTQALAREEIEVRERWNRLRQVIGA